MTEKDFVLLKTLQDTGSITKAADILFITQSALSKRIMAIEEELGAELLIRSRQGIRFTPAGEEVLRHCSAAASELEEMRRNLDSMHGQVCGTLRAGISENYSLYKLPDVLVSYHRKYPAVSLDITTGASRTLYQQLTEGLYDIAVLRGDFPWDGTKFLLSQESVCIVVNRENRNRPLNDLMYISHHTDPTQKARITRWLRENHLEGKSGLKVNSVTSCLEMVKRGLGWALLPEIALDGFDGSIIPCTFENGEPFVRRSYILGTAAASELPQVKMFTEALKKRR